MAYYVELTNGSVCITRKLGRLKKGFKQLNKDVWIPEYSDFDVIIANTSYTCSQIESAINYGFMRKENSFVSLFMCDISPSTKIEELFNINSSSRIDLDVASGAIIVWYLAYDAFNPDLIIVNILEN